jgi:predicted amidohydrolase
MLKKIAAIQMCSGLNLTANLELAKKLLADAAKKGASLAVLPEMFPLLGSGEAFIDKKMAIQEKEGIGPIQTFLSAEAKRLGLWIIGGTIPLASDYPEKTYAACLVFNDKGQQIARYDKIHLFDVKLSDTESYNESNTTVPGNKIVLVDTPIGRIGITVCYDIRFPELYRALFNLGAEIIVVPSAFTFTTGQKHWEILTRARAIENFCYLVCPAQWGKNDANRHTYGNSLIIAPDGQIIDRLETGDGAILANVDPLLIQRERSAIPVKEHQRISCNLGSLQKTIYPIK